MRVPTLSAALAIVADLKCKVPGAAVDAALTPAFDAVRKAEEASSFYEKAVRWSEADFRATEAIALLLQQLPTSASK